MKLRNHLCTGKRMLTPLMLTAVLFSCKKEDVQEPQSFETQSASAALATSPNIIFQDDFEGTSPFATYVRKQTSTSYGITQSTSPLYSGSKVVRFELRDTDPEASGGTRSEVLFPEQTSLNRWYAFAVYFPSAQYKYDTKDELISQWHQDGGTTQAMSIRTGKDRMYMRVKRTSDWETIDLGALAKDKWQTIVMHVKHSPGSDGVIELWLNGQKLVNRSGSNMYSTSGTNYVNPRWKLGVYKANWNGTTTSDTRERVLYYDNVRLGNENATYAEMASAYSSESTGTGDAGSSVAPASPITSFILVNSATESDVKTITNGSTISLSQLGVTKANIRTNTSSAFTSVKFELSGAQSKTATDSKAPFALHGDDGSGNFFYGNWNPPAVGTYTLKATPYSGTTAGTPYSITFTIVK
jgi:hypothetical protein